MTTFSASVLAAMPRSYAARLWPDPWHRADGVQDTIVKALTNAHRFKGGNMAAWLTTMMGNIRKDQRAKGYRKGTIVEEARIDYAGHTEDYAMTCAYLCDPESILITKESYAL